MAKLPSPHYEGLDIYYGENPKAGAFYVPKLGDTIANLSNWAYGGGWSGIARINKSAWNRENCIYRRSDKCHSTVVHSSLALSQNSFGDGAWLALCQADKQPWAADMGFNFPVIWIPGTGNEEPEDLAVTPQPAAGVWVTSPSFDTPGTAVIGPGISAGPEITVTSPGFDEYDPGYQDVTPPKKKAPVWFWIVGGAAVLGVGGYLLLRRK